MLIGTTLTGIDSLRTPFHQDPPISGVYLYAAAISNLLNQSFLRRLPHWQCLLLVIFSGPVKQLLAAQAADLQAAVSIC